MKWKLEGRDFLKEKIRARDNWQCQLCYRVWHEGERRFDTHHQDEHKEGKIGKSYEFSKLFGEMITLCHKCHLNLPTVRKKMSEGKSLTL